jgi:hypothetical protein
MALLLHPVFGMDSLFAAPISPVVVAAGDRSIVLQTHIVLQFLAMQSAGALLYARMPMQFGCSSVAQW